nr:hypothetical protein [Tanacetum cinerariifolium]
MVWQSGKVACDGARGLGFKSKQWKTSFLFAATVTKTIVAGLCWGEVGKVIGSHWWGGEGIGRWEMAVAEMAGK